MMKSSFLAVLLAVGLNTALCAEEQLIRYQDEVATPYGTFGVPSELYMEALDDSEVAVKFALNLASVQNRIPRLLSSVLVDECENRSGLEVVGANAEEDRLIISGRLQSILFSCGSDQDRAKRLKIATLEFDVEASIGLSAKDTCLRFFLDSLALRPKNLTSEVVNAFGFSEDIVRVAKQQTESHLRSFSGCLEFPKPLQIVDARIESVGLRDFGSGVPGAVVSGRLQADPSSFINLFFWLFERGYVDPENGLSLGNWSFRATNIRRDE